MSSSRFFLIGVLVICGLFWGLTQPLGKITVSEGYRHFGIVFWQMLIGAGLSGFVLLLRRKSLPMQGSHLLYYSVVAVMGTVLPNSATYEAARFLPSGVLSIVLAMVPIFAFPMALALGTDRFSWTKSAGLLLGAFGLVLLVGPETSLPERAMVMFIPVAAIAPLLYGFEGNYIARFGLQDVDPVQLLCGASIIGAIVSFPLALGTGHWIDPTGPWGRPDYALVLMSILHASVYATYFWLVGRTGPVFAAQVSYLVTGFGIVWAMLLLGERYSGWVWIALAVMFLALFLVQPRPVRERLK